MKKLLYLIIFSMIISFIFLGFKFDYLNANFKKPNNYYYTNQLAKSFSEDKLIKCTILDTNAYREKDLPLDDVALIKNFLSNINKDNFNKDNKNFPEKPQYKIFVNFSKNKYIINIYNENLLSVYPWDGGYSMDYLNMNNIPLSYNLYNLSKYIIEN